MNDLFTTTNGEGAAAANDNAFKDSGETTAVSSIEANGANGQAQSDRSLLGVMRRLKKNDKIDIRRIHGCYRIVPLNETFIVDDLRAYAESCGIRECGFCHRRVLGVSGFEGVLACPRCAPTVLDNWCRERGTGNGGAR